MKPTEREDRPKRNLLRSWHLAGLLVSSAVCLAVLIGCQKVSSEKGQDTSETAKRLRKLLRSLNFYIQETKTAQGERPNQAGRPSEEGFKAFLAALSPQMLANIGVTNTQELQLVSPRDEQPFAINYDMPLGGPVLAIWEQTGVNGRRYVIYASGDVEEVDEQKFNEIKPKE
jgi:hypothetical protein